ncbi:MAG: FTR1 family iron permease [Chloroflexi bacterium]|nr:FTR1 family iron permease [Chloroflexota bacterium]
MDLGAFTSGAFIGLREGVEAALIVAIVLAYLVRSGNGRHAGKIWLGTLAAAALSALLGVVLFVSVGAFREPWEQLFEGTTMLVAAAVVTWMLFWMRRQAAGLKGDLHAAIERVLGEGTAWGLAALAFASVIREGVETALFLAAQATSVSTSASSVALGAIAGLGGASLIGWGFYRGSKAVDLRKFFRWTGIALVFIAAGLLSKAVHEYLEVAGLSGISVIGTQPAYDLSRYLSEDAGIGQFLRAILGYSASPEVLTLSVHVLYVVGILWLYLRPARPLDPTPRPTVAGA